MSNPSVVIGYAHNGVVHADFMQSVVDVVRARPELIADVINVQSVLIPEARNGVVKLFLQSDAEWLLFLDTDIVFDPNVLDKLLEAADDKHKILGGMYFADLGGGVTPVFLIEKEDQIQPLTEFTTGQIIPIVGTGMGCTLIHRTVFEKMAQVYNDTAWIWFAFDSARGNILGEDLTFCLRAAKLGFQSYGHTGVQIQHIKSRYLGIADFAARAKVEVARDGTGSKK